MRIAITGRRPGKLGGYDQSAPLNQAIIKAMDNIVAGLLMAHGELLEACSGMALGVDQWFAELCVKHGVPWTAFIPCKGHSAVWPAASQVTYRSLLLEAEDRVQVSNEPYSYDCMQKRNEAMVDWVMEVDEDQGYSHACIAVWDGEPKGGTWNCINYARKVGLRVDVIDVNKLKEEVKP